MTYGQVDELLRKLDVTLGVRRYVSALLNRLGVRTLDELRGLDLEQLERQPGVGAKTLACLRDAQEMAGD